MGIREIIFRGKTLTGKWIEGAYYKQELFYGDKEDAHIIITSKENLTNDFELDFAICSPETVGQYTGLTDKNGKKIFEADIVRCKYANTAKNEHIQKVVFYEGKFMAEFSRDGCYAELYYGERHFDFDMSVYMTEIEVIGNIHDNPELLKGGG